MKKNLLKLIFFAALYSASVEVGGFPEVCAYNFEMQAGICCDSLLPSVVDLFDKFDNSIGTGYFIDEESRIMVTASHVLTSQASPITDLFGFNSAINQGRKFAVHVIGIGESNDPDVALLRVTDQNFTGPVTAIDISFRVPKQTEVLWAIGYPGERPGIQAITGILNKVLHPGDQYGWKDDEKAGHSMYEVTKNAKITRGFSGGPLITQSGLAIGTVSREKDDNTGYYEPLLLDGKLLQNLKDLANPTALENAKKMLQKGESEGLLAEALTGGRIRNVDLAVWYYQLLAMPERSVRQVSAMRSLVIRPIVKMLKDRNLDWYAEGLRTAFSSNAVIIDEFDGVSEDNPRE
jgi:hypothetical protein